MVKRPRIIEKSDYVQNKILCFLHYRYANGEEVVFDETELTKCIDKNPRIIHFSLGQLEKQDFYVSTEIVHLSDESVRAFSISADGIELVENWSEEEYQRSSVGIDFLENDDANYVPAANRTVSRSDNQGDWENATAALDLAIAEFREDHKFGNEFAGEKSALIQTLEAGRELLNDEGIKVRMGVALIFEPLKIVQTRVEEYLAEHPGVKDGLTVNIITRALNAISKLLFGV
jgi:hypothetical protein